MGHTPGPWAVIDGGRHWNNPAINNYRIHTNPNDRGFDITKPPYGELVVEHVYEEADAKLIAAAPELLEALKAMLTHMGMDEDEFNKPTFDQARAAIAKAEGK